MDRLDYVDVAKGLGIFIVVIGHCLTYAGLWSTRLFWYIYAFHMPFWFVISGFLYKRKDPSSYITNKVVSLIVPYIAYFSLNIVIYAILACIGKTKLFEYCSFGAFLFLMTLFLVVIAHFLLDLFVYSKSRHPLILQSVVAFCVLILGLIYAKGIAGEPNQPVATAFVGYAYFLLGLGLRSTRLNPPVKIISRIMCFIVGILLSAILMVTSKLNGDLNIDMNTSRYMNGLMFVANSLLGIASFCALSAAIRSNSILQNMGRNSLSILMIHIPVYCSVSCLCYHFGVNGYFTAILSAIISFAASYAAIHIFNRYLPFMLGKIKFHFQ